METDLTKMVEEWEELDRGEHHLPRVLKAMASNIEFTNNCIEGLRKEIEANGKEIEKLKIRHGERIDPKVIA